MSQEQITSGESSYTMPATIIVIAIISAIAIVAVGLFMRVSTISNASQKNTHIKENNGPLYSRRNGKSQWKRRTEQRRRYPN